MKLLEETVLVDDHGVDGLVDDGPVVEHVVVVVVASSMTTKLLLKATKSLPGLRKKREDCFSFRYGKTCVFTGFG
jgi:hypothetical protein